MASSGVAGAVTMSVEFRSECDDIEEAKSPNNTSVAAVAVKNADASVYKIIHGYLKQKNTSIIRVATNVARKAASNKYTTNLTHRSVISLFVLDSWGKRKMNRLLCVLSRLSRKTSDVFDSLLQQQQSKWGNKTGPLLSGISYCIASCSMILLNKVVLSSYNFSAGISLMLYQNLISVVILLALELFRVISTEKLTWKLIKVWIPVNLIFIGMLVSGMYSLRYINVAMVTILKNMTNIITAIGEVYIFKKGQNKKVWAALCLMIVSAVCGGITDISFHLVGYTWQILNCFLTAGYSLTLRRLMDTAKQSTKSGSLNEVSMVLLNNAISIPFALILIVVFNEWEYVYQAEVIREPMFWVVATASGLLGLAISFSSVWFLHQTGPTTYSLVGSLNKIPISVAGILLFNVPVSVENFFSVVFGLFAGIFFAKAKMS
ncbi:GDP-mannose transporter GONST1-like isoform X2 [Phragmites australis]|uniref:GDP-mannose transporter GONST1-like isoform X2 n=1 Tax=Phragmites australis TaxID=29695 RepID=UPI002D78FF0C|nr:GDP-mannose transporter GONST1-like isoform X2 [Phragmites australis]